MKFTNPVDIEEFFSVVNKCKGDVRLESVYGDVYNLKSKLMTYIATTALMNDSREDLELFCDLREDEALFFKFFREHPQVL